MEVDDIQTQTQTQTQTQSQPQPQQQQPEPPIKYSRVSSNGGTHNELVVVGPTENSARSRRATTSGGGGGRGGGGGGLMGELMVGNSSNSRFGRQWQHSSRIIRVSRASGGKDRHSKVLTAKGPRDRRVRLSVTTAIQFYDLQDRLGYDQPSKAVEWLIKAASDAINELPGLNTESFPPPETPPPSRQLSGGGDERKIDGGGVLDSMVDDLGHQQDHQQHQQQQQQQMGSKSGCSSNNSETSKGSGGLSLSRTRSEIRVKARERARERTNNNMAQTSSFTQLLTAGMNHSNTNNKHSTSVANDDNNNNNNNNNSNQWLSSGSSAAGQMADYFGTGLIGVGSNNNNNTSVMTTIASFGSENHHHQLQQQQQQQQPHFPFLSDQHLIQVANGANNSGNGGGGGDYNLNFSISSTSNTSTSGFNNSRGTLQSNSPSLLPYLQRFSAATDGSSLPFFLGNAAVSSDHQHHFQPPGLQLCYGDPGRRQSSDHKGKGKN